MAVAGIGGTRAGPDGSSSLSAAAAAAIAAEVDEGERESLGFVSTLLALVLLLQCWNRTRPLDRRAGISTLGARERI